MGDDSTFLDIERLVERIDDAPLKGILIAQSEAWFPYSVEAVKLLREGLFVAVRNTSSVHLSSITSSDEDQHYSLLRIESVETRHFVIDQIRQDRADAPISVTGLLEQHLQEWQRSSADPEENNLRIVVSVSVTGLELDLPVAASPLRGYSMRVAQTDGTPMLGEIAYLAIQELVAQIVNRGMVDPDPSNQSIVAGTHTLYRSNPLQVLIDTDALFRRHFGLFGFTGAGKSNLLSTLISRTFYAGQASASNVVLFDVNNEFFGLLIDTIVEFDAHVVFLDNEINDSMVRFLDGDYSSRDQAASDFLRTTTLPGPLQRFANSREGNQKMSELLQLLLSAGRFKRFIDDPEPLAVGYYLSQLIEFSEVIKTGIRGTGQTKKREAWTTLIEIIVGLFDDKNRRITDEDFATIHGLVVEAIGYCSDAEQDGESSIEPILSEILPKDGKEKDRHHGDLVGPLTKLAKFVVKLRHEIQSPTELRGHSIDFGGLLNALHDDKRTLMIFLGSENTLRVFADRLGSSVYDYRRRTGTIDPTTVFVFDEADIFVPSQNAATSDDDKDAIKSSRKIATTLARRGRKYGLGLGIATQRIAYLDTSILAQIGTYFVGKLPRLTDRQRITEGFGIEMASLQVGINEVGDWVILSHTAVGDRGSPIPVHFSDANRRIYEFLAGFTRDKFADFLGIVRKTDIILEFGEEKAEFVAAVTNRDYLP
jgi:hypothetical protein